MTKEKFLVTCALPYTNGPLHIGHLAGAYLPGDIFVRFRRMQGHDVHFACGSDEHGVAITFLAKQLGITPRQVVDKYHSLFQEDFAKVGIEFDVYSRTTHPCHAARTQDFFLNIQKAGLIETKTEARLYCESCEQFLPDRYVVGQCPHCGNPEARGDQCEKCGTWYEPEDLISPICQLCKKTGATVRETTHWYISLNKLEGRLTEWLDTKTHWRKNVLGYAYQPIKAELTPRAITRDLDWGIPLPIPGAEGKVFYVWFDAPIGYISASEDWSMQIGQPEKWREYWEDKSARLVHFIGKDNIIFHTVVWPAILMGDGRYNLPDLVAGNEFLNLEGQKISKSRNWAIWVGDIFDRVDRDLLRFYLTRISPETSDSDFYWKDFQSKINTELADIIGNLVNRTLTFIAKNYDGRITDGSFEIPGPIRSKIEETVTQYSNNLSGGFSRMALESVIDLGRFLNGYLQEAAPWKERKVDPAKAHASLYAVCIGIKALTVLFAPICPTLAQKIWEQLGFTSQVKEQKLDECLVPFSATQQVGSEIVPLVAKVEDEFVEAEREKLNAMSASSG